MSDFPRHEEEIAFRRERGEYLDVIRYITGRGFLLDTHQRQESGEWGRPIAADGGDRRLILSDTDVHQ